MAKFPEPNMAFLQISGMAVTFDSAKTGSARIQAISVQGTPMNLADSQTRFTVAMPSQLAMGGAGYVLIFTDEVAKTMVTQEITIVDAIKAAFTRHNGVVSPTSDVRLLDTPR